MSAPDEYDHRAGVIRHMRRIHEENAATVARAFDVPSTLVGLPDDGRRPDPGWEPCPTCDGAEGYADEDDVWHRCPTCGGEGGRTT